MQERLEAELMEVEEESSSKDETIEELKGKVVTAQKGASKARIESKASKDSMKGHTTRVRSEQKELRKQEVAAVREAAAAAEADEALKTKVLKKQACATAAHAKKRAWRDRCEKAEHLAEVRAKEISKLKEENESLIHERDELMMDAEEEEEEGLQE